MIGDWLKETSNTDESDFKDVYDSLASWRFRPKRRGNKVAVNDIKRELFEYGMSGNMYAIIFTVPDEFPSEDLDNEYVDVWDSQEAVKELAHWENLKLIDHEGREIK